MRDHHWPAFTSIDASSQRGVFRGTQAHVVDPTENCCLLIAAPFGAYWDDLMQLRSNAQDFSAEQLIGQGLADRVAFTHCCAVDDGGAPADSPDTCWAFVGRQPAAFKGPDDFLRWCQVDRVRLLSCGASLRSPQLGERLLLRSGQALVQP